MPDGHLAFVLLAGGYKDQEGEILVPAHFEPTWTDTGPAPKHDDGFPRSFPSDNWYADVDQTGKPFPDLLIGRLCARDTTDLRVLIQKTLHYEPMPADPPDWRSTVFLTSAPRYEDAGPFWHHDSTVVRVVFDEIEDIAVKSSYRVRRLKGEYAHGDSLVSMNVASLNMGAGFMTYLVHTDSCGCAMGRPAAFNCRSVENLTNRDSLCVIFSITCMAGNFVSPACPKFPHPCSDLRGSESIGVKFTVHPDGGAVAVIGPADAGKYWGIRQNRTSPEIAFYRSILEHHTPFIAEALAETKLIYLHDLGDSYCESMTLLGDPALNVKLRSGYEDYCDIGVSAAASDLIFEPDNLRARPALGICKTTVWVRNKTHVGVPDVPISVSLDVKRNVGGAEWIELGTGHVDSIPPWGCDSVQFAWSTDSIPADDYYTFRIWVDREDTVKEEAYESNNVVEVDKGVGTAEDPYAFTTEDLGGGLRSPTAGWFLAGGERKRHVVVIDSMGTVYMVNQEGAIAGSPYDAEADDPFPVALGDLEKDGGNLQIVANPSKILALDVFDYGDEVKWSLDLADTVSTAPSLGDFNRGFRGRPGGCCRLL